MFPFRILIILVVPVVLLVLASLFLGADCMVVALVSLLTLTALLRSIMAAEGTPTEFVR